MAEEVYETTSDDGLRSSSRNGMEPPDDMARQVTILTLQLGKVALAQISGTSSSSVLIDIANLGTSVSDSQDYQQFQFRYLSTFSRNSSYFL